MPAPPLSKADRHPTKATGAVGTRTDRGRGSDDNSDPQKFKRGRVAPFKEKRCPMDYCAFLAAGSLDSRYETRTTEQFLRRKGIPIVSLHMTLATPTTRQPQCYYTPDDIK